MFANALPIAFAPAAPMRFPVVGTHDNTHAHTHKHTGTCVCVCLCASARVSMCVCTANTMFETINCNFT